MLRFLTIAVFAAGASAQQLQTVTSLTRFVSLDGRHSSVSAAHATPPRHTITMQSANLIKAVVPISLQSIADMNPDQTSEACIRCTNGQQIALEKDAEVVPLAKAHVDALGVLNEKEIVEKDAQQRQIDAQGDYMTAVTQWNLAKADLKDKLALLSAASTLERSATDEANAALEQTKLDCNGFNLPVITAPTPDPFPDAPEEAVYIKTAYNSNVFDWNGRANHVEMKPVSNTYMNGDNQKFYVQPWAGAYLIKIKDARGKEKCLDFHVNANEFIYWDCHMGSNQLFYFDGGEGLGKEGAAYLKTQYSDQCIDYHLGNSKLYLHGCHGGNNQKFFFEKGE